MKLDAFTIFLIILGLLVVVAIFINLTTKRKETFVNFQNNQPSSYGTNIYIPQYTTDSTHTVLSLYDNLYFDTQNATLIEVNSPSCPPGKTGALCKDLTGASISEITVVPRDGLSLTSYPSGPLKPDGTVIPFSTPQSQQKSVNPAYNQFTYTTTCDSTDLYQVFYVSWFTNTYLHVIDLSGVNTGINVKTFNLSATGLVDTITYPTGSTLPPFTKSPPALNDSNNNTSATDPNYLSGAVKLYQLAAETTSNATIKLLYDITNGNIVVNLGTGTYNVYNRAGTGAPANQNTIKNNTPLAKIEKTNTFMINDLPNVAVLVLAYQYDTVISVITSRSGSNEYKMVYSYRFNKTGLVNNSSNDTDNVAPTSAPTGAPTSSPSPSTRPTGLPTGLSNGDITLNNVSNLNSSANNTSEVCGDDLSCKWYWYFNTIAQHKNGVDYLSDDYFLKTEAIPPVCPQCPQCPSSGGTCTNCGGNGGGGCSNATTVPATSAPKLKPSTNPSLPPGAVTDNSGNTYIPYTDNSGNTRYVLYSNGGSQQGVTGQQSGSQQSGSQQSGSQQSGSQQSGGQGGPKFITAVDKDGQFVTSADPDTLGGGLAVSTLSLDQLGTAGFNTAGGFANNVVNTAGNVVGGTVNSATNLVGGVANTAANLVGGVASGVTNLAGGVVGTAADLAKGAGSGLMHLGNGQYGQYGQQGGFGGQQGGFGGQQGGQSTGSSLGYTPFGSTPDSTFGNIPGKTPVDNYSYYGATQSKGGNYMPVTADFSAFGK